MLQSNLSMCVHVYVCSRERSGYHSEHTNMRVYAHIIRYKCVYILIYEGKYVCVHTYIKVRVCAHTHIRLTLSMDVIPLIGMGEPLFEITMSAAYACMYMYVLCMCVSMYMYIYIYTHTDTQTYTQARAHIRARAHTHTHTPHATNHRLSCESDARS